MERSVRIGAVSYLNTKPLVYGLERFLPRAEISYEVPSRLADHLAQGELDVALIPSVEFFQDPEYTILSDACIACRGPVLSVKLLSRVPIDQIRSLALDEGSRTSVALVRILLEQRFGLRPRLEQLPIDASLDDCATDALLVIGDRAIHPPSQPFVAQWDLGDQWCRWSELPFVFAMWTARAGVELEGVASALNRARDAGVRHLKDIAAAESAAVGLSPDSCLSYLRDNLHFHLGPREQRGLQLFYEHAAGLQLAPPEVTLRFHDYQVT